MNARRAAGPRLAAAAVGTFRRSKPEFDPDIDEERDA
jgi:hypothetical protein